MDWVYLFTSFEGRIGRKEFWMGILVMFVVGIVAGVLDLVLGTAKPDGLGLVGIIAVLIMLYQAIALYAKRWHDRGKSGWWTLISFVPVIGFLWMLVELGILKGTDGANHYGADPVFT